MHASGVQKVSKPFSVIIIILVIKIFTKLINKCKLILEKFAHMQTIKQKIKLMFYTIKKYALKIAFDKKP